MIDPNFTSANITTKKSKQPIQNSEIAKDVGSPQHHCRIHGFTSLTLAMPFITM